MTSEVESRSPQVDPEHYGANYDSRKRFLSYWNQVEQVRRAKPTRVLEVGIGNGFVSRYLRASGYDVHTVDFDERLGPDTVASVTALPFSDRSFDVVCCFETLEHLPWKQLVPSLRELARCSSRRVLVSLPDVTPFIRLAFALSYKGRVQGGFDYPALWPRKHRFDGEHHWEIGKRGFPLRRIRAALAEAGLRVEEIHRDYDDPYHRFFVCSV